ncbi:MAG TPA: ABC transporter permease [Candidatus Methylomirabilis sp.]|nr:ABC transporter permease [Candidatus Methylomirabilis sp.]
MESLIIEPPRGSAARHLDPVRMLGGLWRHRELTVRLIGQEVAQRYRGSYLGIVWSFITPILMLSVYAFVFSVVFRARWGDAAGPMGSVEFALTLFAGLVPFGVFSEVLNRAPSIVLAVPNYVKKVVFPLEILPVVAVGSAVVHSFISAGILLAGTLVLLGSVSPTAVLLPLAYLPLVLLALGLCWFLASLGVYVRDVGQAIGIATQVLFFLSPIFYPISAVPERFRPFIMANPLTEIIAGFRRTMLWGSAPGWSAWAVLTAATALIALLGYAWFMQTRRGFADVM